MNKVMNTIHKSIFPGAPEKNPAAVETAAGTTKKQ